MLYEVITGSFIKAGLVEKKSHSVYLGKLGDIKPIPKSVYPTCTAIPKPIPKLE